MTDELKQIGNFQIIKLLAQGGMGEVFLAKDLTCGRRVALKKIREDLIKNTTIRERFLREAKLTAQLSHPSIIPIYSIHQEGDVLYYTMPYVEGETLREILRETKIQEKSGEITHPLGSSIPSLIRVFLHICEAVAYAHVKGIMHRDIKPENIIVGKFGEAMILDWGIAGAVDMPEIEIDIDVQMATSSKLTKPGKIAGTLVYMAPERALRKETSPLTDIYSLGVILYQLLTLRLPFYRTTQEKFKRTHKHERLIDPQEIAPYRDIPVHLGKIALRCLAPKKEDRYQSVDELIADLRHYIEGRFEWIDTSLLNPENKDDWEFQENIMLAKHMAITQEVDVMEWVYLMVSKSAFSGNTKLSTTISLKKEGKGVGFLLCIPEQMERKNLEEGYCLWVSNAEKRTSKLFRNNVEVLDLPSINLVPGKSHKLEIEKIENNLYFYLNGTLQFSYLSYIPLTGTHVGLLFRDTLFEMSPLKVSTASHNALVNCLSVPDSFLSTKHYGEALARYRQIAISFKGRTEGREALFRAGLTLLEKGKSQTVPEDRDSFFSQALNEFGTLHGTPAAPLEYLGKSLVYQATDELEEEIKCLELALRKFPKHPQLSPIVEQISFRLHETSSTDRIGAYHFTLLALRFLPDLFNMPGHKKLLDSLTEHWTPLPFLEESPKSTIIALAFWLTKPLTLAEIAQEADDPKDRANAHFALLELGAHSQLSALGFPCDTAQLISNLDHSRPLTPDETRILAHHIQDSLDRKEPDKIAIYFSKIEPLTPHLRALQVEALLWQNKTDRVRTLLNKISNQDAGNYTFLEIAYESSVTGKHAALTRLEKAVTRADDPSLTHFYQTLQKTPLATPLFPYEQIALFRRLALFSHCTKEEEHATLYQSKLRKVLHDIQARLPSISS